MTKKTSSFNGILNVWESEQENLKNLIYRTTYNDIWLKRGNDDIYLLHDSVSIYEILDEIPDIIDYTFESCYRGIADKVRDDYHRSLIEELESNPERWDLLQQIEDGIIPFEEWPKYSKYLEDVEKAKAKFDASESAIELRQLKKDWENYFKSPKTDFNSVDWTDPKNRSDFLKWLSYFDSDPSEEDYSGDSNLDGEFFMNLDYSDCLNYEDFCLNAPYFIYQDSNGLMKENISGLFKNIEFLVKHFDSFFSGLILEHIVSNLDVVKAINQYPNEMLELLSDACYYVCTGCNIGIIQHIDEYNIPEDLKDEYCRVFDELKAECRI